MISWSLSRRPAFEPLMSCYKLLFPCSYEVCVEAQLQGYSAYPYHLGQALSCFLPIGMRGVTDDI